MGFRSFCASLGAGLPEPPTIQPRDFLSDEVDEAVDGLMPWLDEIVTLWEVYARIGGFPQAVAGYLAKGDLDPAFSGDL